MFDLEFFAFLRKPERIHVDKMKHYYRVVMSLDDKFYHGEDIQITQAVQKCAKLVYEAFKKFKHRGNHRSDCARKNIYLILSHLYSKNGQV